LNSDVFNWVLNLIYILGIQKTAVPPSRYVLSVT